MAKAAEDLNVNRDCDSCLSVIVNCADQDVDILCDYYFITSDNLPE